MPKLIHQETMCCGYKKCPNVSVFDDGSIELSDDDAEKGSVGVIKLASDQAERLAELLTQNRRK